MADEAVANHGHLDEELADDLALGLLEPGVEGVLRGHVEECGRCAELVERAEAATALLALSTPRTAPSAELRERVMAASGARQQWSKRLMRGLPAGAAIAAAAVAIVSLIGFVSLEGDVTDLQDENTVLQRQVNQALSQEVEIASLQRGIDEGELRAFELETAARGDRDLLLALLAPETEVAEFFSVDQRASGIGRLVWDPQVEKLFFVATGLSQLSSAQTYQVWVDEEGTYRSLGTFQPDDSGYARFEASLPASIANYQSAIVTMERRGGVAEREGASVLVADLATLRER